MSKIKTIKQKYVIIATILLGICIILPILFHKDFFDTFTSLVMALCSVITLFIAIMLYDKYGIEHTIKDKNFIAVNKLMEDLLEMNIAINVINNESLSHKDVCILLNIDFQCDYMERIYYLDPKYQSSQLYFSDTSLEKLTEIISKGKRNLYMPPSIVDKLKNIDFDCLIPITEEEMPSIIYCVFCTQINDNGKNMYTPEDFTTLYTYFERLDELKKECVQWLYKNGGDGSLNTTLYSNAI
jgi:hypothetical protein